MGKSWTGFSADEFEPNTFDADWPDVADPES